MNQARLPMSTSRRDLLKYTALAGLSGPIRLRSNMELHVPQGARLKFIPDPARYLPPVLTRWEGVELMGYHPLIYALVLRNLTIAEERKPSVVVDAQDVVLDNVTLAGRKWTSADLKKLPGLDSISCDKWAVCR